MKLIRSVSIVLGALALTSCVTTTAVTDQLPEPAAFAEGQGMVIGSIVMVTPTGVADAEQKEMIDALRQRKLRATIQRYEIRGPGWSTYVGERFVVSFGVDAEQRIVLRAPAGKYTVLELAVVYPGLFGDEQTGSRMEEFAGFEIRTEKTTYIGKLVVSAGFKSDEGLKLAKAFETAIGMWVIGMQERWLDMSLNVTDAKQATLRDLAADPSRAPAVIETELMRVGRARWHYDVQPAPAPPEVPGKK